MDVRRYLDRIQFIGSVDPTPETLRELQGAHMRAVPFENLDVVPLHRPIQLTDSALWDKIVVRKRGGFCYELNGGFAWLLKQLGFDVAYLNARVFKRTGGLGPDFDHLALLVRSPADPAVWLADVGFGDSFIEPLPLEEGEYPQGQRAYRLERNSAGYIVWQRESEGAWERLYFFDLSARRFPSDYEAACSYHQRSPESHFTRQSIVSKVTTTGRISLEPDKLILTENGVRKERAITREEWHSLLLEHFGIVL